MQKKFLRLSQHGFSLVQVIIAAGILAVLAMTSASFFTNQIKANNYLEFQAKREQLRLTILGQFLSDPNNCKCLFANAPAFATPGPSTLAGTPPTQIGKFNFTTPGVCGTATLPSPLTSSTGVDGIRSTTIQLRNIVDSGGGTHTGLLVIGLQSLKEVQGPQELMLTFPVDVQTAPSGPGTVSFLGCSTMTGGGPVIPIVGTCPVGQFATGYDVNGVLQCAPPTYQ